MAKRGYLLQWNLCCSSREWIWPEYKPHGPSCHSRGLNRQHGQGSLLQHSRVRPVYLSQCPVPARRLPTVISDIPFERRLSTIDCIACLNIIALVSEVCLFGLSHSSLMAPCFPGHVSSFPSNLLPQMFCNLAEVYTMSYH